MGAELEELAQVLRRERVSKLGPEIQSVRTLKASETVGVALSKLASWGVVSAPCIDASGQYIGLVSVSSVLSTFLHEVGDDADEHQPMLQRMRNLEDLGETFGQKAVRSCMEDRPVDNAFVADHSTSVLEALHEGFVKQRQHRIPVIERNDTASAAQQQSCAPIASSACQSSSSNRNRLSLSPESVPASYLQSGSNAEAVEIVTIVSASDVAHYLDQNASLMGELNQRTLGSLGFGARGAQSVAPRTPTLDVLRRLEQTNTRGIAVTEQDGFLVANLSLADFSKIELSHLGSLALPCAEFLALLHGTTFSDWNPASSSHKNHPFFLSAGGEGKHRTASGQLLSTRKPGDTFGSALHTLVSDKVHRLYICEQDSLKPLDAFSLFDALSTSASRLPLDGT